MIREFTPNQDQAENNMDEHIYMGARRKPYGKIWEHIRQQRANGDKRPAEEIFQTWLKEGGLNQDHHNPDDQHQ